MGPAMHCETIGGRFHHHAHRTLFLYDSYSISLHLIALPYRFSPSAIAIVSQSDVSEISSFTGHRPGRRPIQHSTSRCLDARRLWSQCGQFARIVHVIWMETRTVQVCRRHTDGLPTVKVPAVGRKETFAHLTCQWSAGVFSGFERLK